MAAGSKLFYGRDRHATCAHPTISIDHSPPEVNRVHTKRFPYPGLGRCEAVVSDGMVYAVATDPALSDEIDAQTRNALLELDRILANAGSDKAGLLQATVYLSDIKQKRALDPIWIDWIGPEANWPQRACVGVDLDDGCLIEIVVTAKTL